MVQAALLWVLRRPQKEMAEAADRTDRTVREWQQSPLWPEAVAEARALVPGEAQDEIWAALLNDLRKGNVELAKWMAERMLPQLAPPVQRTAHDERGQFAFGVVELPAATEGKDSLQAADVLASMRPSAGVPIPAAIPPAAVVEDAEVEEAEEGGGLMAQAKRRAAAVKRRVRAKKAAPARAIVELPEVDDG